MNEQSFPEIREAVRRLCVGFPGEYWRELDRDRAYPTAFVEALTRDGYLAALIPEEYGGLGLGLGAAVAILEEIHRSGSNGGASHAQMYTMGAILRHGSEAQKQEYLPKLASGELRLQAFGVTEPGAGTDTTRISTFARRDGDRYIVNGQKIWISRAEHSDLMLLLCRTSPRDPARPSQGMSVLLVDMREAVGKGLTIRPIRTMINHATTELFFDDLEVPAANLIGEEGKGFKYILDGMNAERILIAAECIGDGRFFIDRASAYANEREVFGRKIGVNQGIQFPIARAHVQISAAALMVEHAAALFDSGQVAGTEANMAKMLASEASWAAADMCIQTHGGFGFAEEYDIERKFRETRLYQIAPISTNLILSHVATHALGLPQVILMGALDGIIVVSIEQAVAAPLCTARLAEAGARVIKVERAEGDFARGYDSVVSGDSAFFVWLNRGKESVVLDIKQPEDAALLERMIARADIFVQNFAPGAAARSGFGSEELRARHTRLITCDISGYGDDGPYRDMRAYDLLIQCESGFASVTGSPEAPGRAGVSIADISCGTTAYAGLVQALFERERSGVARGLSVSLFDTLAEWMTVPLLHAEHGAGPPARTGLRHPILAPYGLYATGDGEGVVLAVQNEREWARFCEQVLDLPSLAADQRFASNGLRVANRSQLDQAITEALKPLDRAELVRRLAAAAIAYGSLNSVDDLSEHPALRRVGASAPGGELTLPASPLRWNGEAPEPMASPALGADTQRLREEFR